MRRGKYIFQGIFYKGFLFSQKNLNLAAVTLTHALEVFFARPVVVVGISGLLGGTLGFGFSFVWALPVFLLIHAFLFLWQFLFSKDSQNSRYRTALLILTLVMGLYCMSLISLDRTMAEEALTQDMAAEKKGTLTDDPSEVNPETQASSGSSDSIYEGYIISISLPDDNYKTYTLLWKNKIKVSFGSSRTDLAFGQHVRIYGSLSPVSPARNPGGFDQQSFYGRQGIFLSLDTFDNNIYIQKDSAILPDLFVRLEILGLGLRRNITLMWALVLDQDDAALLSGMILGDTSQMPPELKTAFRMCGLAHLTAVSGANVAYFLVPVTAFFQKVSGRRGVRHALVFAFLIFFGFLTGWTASVTRALFMSAGTIFSSVLMKRHDPISAMFLSAAILMFNNPYVSVDLGFLLSFSATLSLILFSDKMAGRMKFLPGPEILKQAGACLLCTQLGMLPWLIALSGRESILLFLTNLTGSFLSEGISLLCLPLSAGLLAAQAAPFFLPFVRILFLPLGGLLFVLAKMAYLCQNQAVSALRLSSVEPVLLFSVSILILTFLLPRGFLTRNLRRIMCAFLVIGIALQLYTYINRPICTVLFADIGQGDSALILLNNNKSVLIDGGDIGSAKNVLIPLLNYYGIREPDITILTHLHRDHGAGIIELIEAGRVSSVYTPCVLPNKELSELFSLEADNRVTLHSIEKDDKIVLSETAVLYVLSPESITMQGGNDDSAVLFLDSGSTGVLFMGDAGEAIENRLLMQPEIIGLLDTEADFLKVGHHGSKFSSTQDFLTALSLKAAVISVGENNYGHPTAETLERLGAEGIDIYRTDISGAILLEITKNKSRIYEYCS